MAAKRVFIAIALVGLLTWLGLGVAAAKAKQAAKASAPEVPAFADRTKIPASGKQGPPGKAATLSGRSSRGKALFERRCQSCHGPRGTDHVKNPGSDDGTVPPLHPIDPALADKTIRAFAAKIDPYIQHGSVPDGPSPALFMPNWGDSEVLSQQEIADVEAYVMGLNGVRARK